MCSQAWRSCPAIASAVQVKTNVLPSFGETRNGAKKNKIKEMDKLLNFRDDPTTKIKTAISFFMYLQTG
jgi:hypothetical protein